MLDHAAQRRLFRRQFKAVAGRLAVRVEIVEFVDVLEIQAGCERGQRFVEERPFAQRVDFDFLESGIVNPHGMAVADGDAGVGRADIAAEFVRGAEIDEPSLTTGLLRRCEVRTSVKVAWKSGCFAWSSRNCRRSAARSSGLNSAACTARFATGRASSSSARRRIWRRGV